jgi:hypothetical protein
MKDSVSEPFAPSYQRETDSSGHTVYRRKRIIYEPTHSFVNTETSNSSSTVATLFDLASLISNNSSSDMTMEQSHPSSVEMNLTEDKPSEKPANFSSALSVTLLAQEETINSEIAYEFVGDIASWDLGLSMVNSDKNYFGFSTMFRIHAPWKVAPYLGAGAYGGDSESCSVEPIAFGLDEETCEKYFLISLTTEAGLRYTFNKRVQMRLAARYFTNTRQDDPLGRLLYGVNLGVLF